MNNNAKFAFFYILAAISLVFIAIALGLISFFIIDKEIVDILITNSRSANSSLRFAISALIIATPIFYLTSYQIYQNLKKGLLGLESSVRKWLTYLIILVAAVVMLGWLVGLINNFLGGELSSRFAIKALVAISLSLIIFSFYYFDIRRQNITKKNSRFLRRYSYLALALIIAVFTTSWFFVESPRIARAKKIDQMLSNNIASLRSNIQLYYFQNQKLPLNLAELGGDQKLAFNHTAQKELKYQTIGGREYELCASFQLNNMVDSNYNTLASYGAPDSYRHQAGYQCFKYQVSSPVRK